jgi:protein-disulfide isomerase-like protein with CxxC motif
MSAYKDSMLSMSRTVVDSMDECRARALKAIGVEPLNDFELKFFQNCSWSRVMSEKQIAVAERIASKCVAIAIKAEAAATAASETKASETKASETITSGKRIISKKPSCWDF